MKRKLAVFLAALVAAMSLTACSPQSQPSGTAEATPAPIVVPEPVEQTNKELKIYYADYANTKLLDTAVKIYQEQYPDVKLEVEKPAPVDFEDYTAGYQQLANEIMAGEGPDLFFVNQAVMDVEKMARQGVFADMQPFFEEDDFDWEPYQKTVMDGGVWDGKRLVVPCSYSIPLAITTQSALEETGFSVENCSDFMGFVEESNKFLEQSGQSRYLFQDLNSPRGFYWWSGLDFLDYDRHTVNFSTEEMKKSLEWYQKQYDPDRVPGYSSTTYGAADIRDGKALLFVPTITLLDFFTEYAALETVDEAVMFPIRNMEGGVNAQIGDSVAVRNNSENLQNAYDFIKILLSPECMDSLRYHALLDISVLKQFNYDRYQTFITEEDGAIYKKGTNGFPAPDPIPEEDFDEFMGYTEEIEKAYFSNRSGMINSMEPYFSGELSLEEAMAQAERELELYLTE